MQMQVVCGLGKNVYYRGSLGMLECREERDSIKDETKDIQIGQGLKDDREG